MEMMEASYPHKILPPGEGTLANMFRAQGMRSKNPFNNDVMNRNCTLPSPSCNVMQQDREMVGADELLANDSYKVRASELSQVAQRLEQLEKALEAAQDSGVSHHSTEAVHYNPSDLAGWIECVLGELAPSFKTPQYTSHQHIYHTDYGVIQATTCASGAPIESSGVSSSANHALQVGSVAPHLGTAGEFPHELEVHSGLHTSESYRKRSVGGIFGKIYSAEQLGFDQDVITKQGSDLPFLPSPKRESHSFLAPTSRDLYPEKRNIIPGCRTYSRTINEKPFIVKDASELFSSATSHRLSSVEDPQTSVLSIRQVSQPSATILDAELDSEQESGLRLVHLLLACAESIHRNDLVAAVTMVQEIRVLAKTQSGPMKRVATQFVDALARRIYGINSRDIISRHKDSVRVMLHFHFYETCPFLKFAHFTANQAILEAFENHRQVHVIDLNLMDGLQWPALIQALALRPGGPPSLSFTGIGLPQSGGNDTSLQEIGVKLAQLAKSLNMEFDFRGVLISKLDDMKPWMLQVLQGEALAVNSVFQLHKLVYTKDPAVASPPVVEVLEAVRSLNPRIVTIVEQEANHNSPIFLDRFMEALHYYSAMFDSFEACSHDQESQELMWAETYLGREICNIVACEGVDRTERHETSDMWRIRMCNSGFQPLLLGSNAFKQARMLLTLYSGEGYTVEENSDCLTLGWQNRPLIAASAWQCC